MSNILWKNNFKINYVKILKEKRLQLIKTKTMLIQQITFNKILIIKRAKRVKMFLQELINKR